MGFKLFGGGEPNNQPLDVAAIQERASAAAKASETQESSLGATDVPPAEQPPETREELNQSAEKTLQNFFAVTKKEGLPPYIRDPKRVTPLILDYYAREPFETHEFLGLKNELQEFEVAGPGFWAAEADVGSPRSRTMILEKTPQGFRIDWEYYVQYNPMNWSTFIKEAPADPMDFRVYANIAPDYRHPFTDERRYLGINLMTLNDTSEIMGYAERESELGKRLLGLLEGKHEELCILRLQFPSGSTPGDKAVYIRELVNPHWIITDDTPDH
jgi:hypothetical protein